MERLSPVFWTLKLTFGLVPIVAGLDKFTNLLVQWEKYIAPPFAHLVPPHGFMMLVGVIEIVAGIGVFVKPRVFAYIVAVGLLLIIINLLTIPAYYDIALRDLGLALGALALGRLSPK